MQPRVSPSRRVTVLAPKTPAQRDYLRRVADAPADVGYAAKCIQWAADEHQRRSRGGVKDVSLIASMRKCARRLDLLARSLKRVVRHG